MLIIRAGSRTLNVMLHRSDDREHFPVRLNGRALEVRYETLETVARVHERNSVQAGPVIVSAPMAGRITSLKAKVGSVTEEGQPLVVLEAMKMENEVAAPRRGVVKEVYVHPGSLVKPGDKLVLVE